MSLQLGVALVSDLGLRRPKNDDSGYAGPRLLAVADGMGGHAGGDVASALTIDALRELDATPVADSPEIEAGLLTAAAARADQRISERGRAEPGLSGMGTTLTAALVHGDSLVFAHIGDSRAYLYRPADAPEGGRAELVQLTHDHTFVQSMVDEGQLSPEDAKKSPYRSVILRVLDGRPDNEPDTFVVDLVDGDRVLLCSDGLSDFAEEQIRDRLADADDPDTACQALLDAALDAGAPDNVTVLIAYAFQRSEALPVPAGAVSLGEGAAADDVAGGSDGGPPDGPGGGRGTSGGALGGNGGDRVGSNGRRLLTAAAPIIVGSAAMAAEQSGEITVGNLPIDARLDEDDGDQPDDDDEEDRRYAPRPRPGWRWLRRSLIALAVVVVLVAAGALGYRWTQQQYYVGTVADDGHSPRIAIYQGIAEPVTGIELSHVHTAENLTLDQLPTYQRERVSQTISAKNLAAAQAIVAQLTTIARRCAGQTTGTGPDSSIPLECSGVEVTPTPTPTPTRTPKPTARATAKPTPRATTHPKRHSRTTKTGSTKTGSTKTGSTKTGSTKTGSTKTGSTRAAGQGGTS